MPNKGILTEIEVLKIASGSPAPTPFGEIRRLVQSGYDAAIKDIASTPVEGEVLTPHKIHEELMVRYGGSLPIDPEELKRVIRFTETAALSAAATRRD